MAPEKANMLVLNSAKNVSQFMLGTAVAAAVFGYNFSLMKILPVTAGFVLAYCACYLYNDIVNLKEDRKDAFKLKLKMLARGELGVETAKKLMYAFLVFGIALSIAGGLKFLAIVSLMLIINFLYTSPKTSFRDRTATFAASIFVLEMLKFMAGWIAYAESFANFPLWFFAAISIFYIALGRAYKEKLLFSEILKDNTIVFSGISGGALYIISLAVYQLKLQMLVPALLSAIVVAVQLIYNKKEQAFERVFYSALAAIAVMFITAGIFSLTPLGIFNSANAKIASLLSSVFPSA